MVTLETTTWGTLEVDYDDLPLVPEDVDGLAWSRAGVVRTTWGRHSVTFATGPYAGRVVIPGRCVIDIRELVPGTVAAMLSSSYSGLRWAEENSSSGTVTVAPWRSLVERFAELFCDYVSAGVARRYSVRRRDTSLPRGKIQVAETMRRHRARGRRDIVTCKVRELGEDSPVHRLLVSAAIRAERLIGTEPVGPGMQSLRRALPTLSAVPIETYPDLAAARREMSDGLHPAPENLIALAELIVKGVAAIPHDGSGDQAVSMWINVDLLFEQTVRRAIDDLAQATVTVGAADSIPILTGGDDGLLDAHPDVVLRRDRRCVLADAKYRRHGPAVSRPELYQLLAHCSAYSAERGALIVPRIGSADTNRRLGTDAHGCAIDVVVVDPDKPHTMRAQLAHWLERCDLAKGGLKPPAAVGSPGPATRAPALS